MRSKEFILREARLDPEMLRAMKLAKAMYPMYDEETAFLKYLQHSSLRGEETDEREDSAIATLDKKVTDIANRVTRLEKTKPAELDEDASISPRLDITTDVRSVPGHERIFFEAHLNKDADDTPAWIRAVVKPRLIAEATCELRNGDECYVGHIQAHSEGKGYASELLKYIIGFYNKKGINKFSAYINHNNANSKNLFQKAGFTEATKKREGSYWKMNL